MPINDDTDVHVRDVWRTLARRKKLVLVTFLLVVALTGVVMAVLPKAYVSEAKLFVRLGRESVTLDPTATTGDTVEIRPSRESEINSIVEVLKSRAICEKIIDTLGPDEILTTPEQTSWSTDLRDRFDKLISSWISSNDTLASPAQKREAAVAAMQRRIRVTLPTMSTLITVSYQAQSPELAQKIVTHLVDALVDEHMRLNRTAGSEEFFANQTSELQEQLIETEQELRDLKNQNNIASIAGQLALLEAQKQQVQEQQLRNERELATSEAKYRSLKASAQTLEETVLAERVEGMANPAADGMRQQLFDKEIDAQELLEKYKGDHPYLPEIKRQLAAIRQIQSNEANSRAQSIHAINPNWQQVQLSLLQESSQMAALAATADTLKEQQVVVLDKLRDLNSFAVEFARLERESDLLQSTYRTYAHNLEQARIDAELQKQRISNINVVQPASLVLKPDSPKKKVVAGVGLIAALFGGFGCALFAELFSRPLLKSATDVEEALALPVLVSIPRSSRHQVKSFHQHGGDRSASGEQEYRGRRRSVETEQPSY